MNFVNEKLVPFVRAHMVLVIAIILVLIYTLRSDIIQDLYQQFGINLRRFLNSR